MLILLHFMETQGVALGYVGDKIRYIVIIRVRFTAEFFCRTRIYRINTDASLGIGFQPNPPSMPLNNQKPTPIF